jgi:hypothetical protein
VQVRNGRTSAGLRIQPVPAIVKREQLVACLLGYESLHRTMVLDHVGEQIFFAHFVCRLHISHRFAK